MLVNPVIQASGVRNHICPVFQMLLYRLFPMDTAWVNIPSWTIPATAPHVVPTQTSSPWEVLVSAVPFVVMTLTAPCAPESNLAQLLSCTTCQALTACAAGTTSASPQALAYHSPHNWSVMMRCTPVTPPAPLPVSML